MKNKIIAVTAILLIAITFTNCKKGDTGPAGKDGVNGNANVVGTNIVTVNSWTASSNSWSASMTASGITQNIVDKGVVSVFVQYGNEWWSLPDLNGKNSTQYGYGVGTVSLLNANSDGSTAPNPGATTFRIVIISPSNRLAHPNTNWKNYNEVKAVLNLED